MNTPRNIRIPSALGAILAATLMTVISAVPEAVHAQDGARIACADKISHDFRPVLL
ncbi:hypothetical protein [Sphingomonas sp. LaA6.9]|uniref:hypothetical protein n=1 Tax=Sphingomonas sp. LaA6.9 TaxID=2919914 RepID=UPI001F502355|nr:hypothetical protein [Sphingomonas sp. LaA6.9]MCJ8156241.1 hypothetical protein [Sphingomonas sp. LaA6.9]